MSIYIENETDCDHKEYSTVYFDTSVDITVRNETGLKLIIEEDVANSQVVIRLDPAAKKRGYNR